MVTKNESGPDIHCNDNITLHVSSLPIDFYTVKEWKLMAAQNDRKRSTSKSVKLALIDNQQKSKLHIICS